MPYGYLDTHYIDFPANVDVAYLEGLRNRAGVDFAQVLREIDARLGAFNGAIDPLVASLITPTTEPVAEASAAVAFEVTARGEYTLARPQLVEGAAHMLPLNGYDVTLGLTEDGLEDMSLNRIITNIESMLLGYRRLHRLEALRRLTSDAELRVNARTTVTSPGFAGSGTGDNVFPRTTYPDGTALPGSYTHYYAVAAGTLAATLLAARDRLRRWHMGPFDLIASADEIALITAINAGNPATGFVSAGSALVRPGIGDAAAAVDPTVYLGVLFGDVRIHMTIDDWSDPVIAMFKSYGALDPRNPLAWRYDELRGRNAVLRYRSLYPLDNAVLKQDFGIGVNDRTAAVLIDTGAAPYTAPTIA
jgi:hypothetical protein